jgi:uncharacterized membrane protein
MTSLTWILLVLGAVLAYSPTWTRPDLYFGVTVESGFFSRPQAKRILRRYWIEVVVHTLIACCLAGLVRMENPWTPLTAIAWLVIGSAWAIARAHRVTAQYAAVPSPVREAKLFAQPETLPGGWLLAIGPFIFLAAAAVYAQLFWDDLPQRIAVHWGLQGADRWVERTPGNVFGFLALLASVCGMCALLAYGTLRWSRTISVTGERARGEVRFRRGSIWLLLGVPYLVVIPGVALAFWPGAPAAWLWPVAVVAVIVASLVILIRMGQGGSRLVDPAGDRPPVGDHTPDTAWKWGLVYYNPDDPALIVEKRIGFGYTLNFGNRWAWPLTALILLPAALAIALR